MNLDFVFFPIIMVWLIGVSFVLYKVFALFNKLTKGVEVSDIKKVLEKILTKEEEHGVEISDAEKRIVALEEDSQLHIQKVGLVRFNPFRELGGDHSFSLAILNGQDSGIIITSLHTRDRTRVYMKDIKKGKSLADLSNEEKKALAIAEKQ